MGKLKDTLKMEHAIGIDSPIALYMYFAALRHITIDVKEVLR